MNVYLKTNCSLFFKANHTCACLNAFSAVVPQRGDRVVGVGGGVNTRANLRGFTTNFRSLNSSPKEVLTSWAKSIISETSSDESKGNVLKRPPVATFQKGVQSKKATPHAEPLKLRRKLSDNSWTTVPMDKKIIWVDGEMSGLDPRTDKLLEIGVIITDEDLNEIASHDSVVFHVEDSVLDGMTPWCVKQHGASGLTEACRKSKITHEEADEVLLKFVQKHTTPGECPMAGNSIGQDRGFIRYQLPKFYSHFHYRDIDVSSIKELVRRWYPQVFGGAPRKKMAHRVLDDIRDSIAELKFYRSTIFVTPADSAVKLARVKNS